MYYISHRWCKKYKCRKKTTDQTCCLYFSRIIIQYSINIPSFYKEVEHEYEKWIVPPVKFQWKKIISMQIQKIRFLLSPFGDVNNVDIEIEISTMFLNNMARIHYCPKCEFSRDRMKIQLKLMPSMNLVCQRCNFIGYEKNEILMEGFRPDQYTKGSAET